MRRPVTRDGTIPDEQLPIARRQGSTPACAAASRPAPNVMAGP